MTPVGEAVNAAQHRRYRPQARAAGTPPRICPVIMPGRETRPVTDIELMVGISALRQPPRARPRLSRRPPGCPPNSAGLSVLFGRRSGRLCGKRADNFLAGPPLLVISLRRPSSSEMLPRLAARPRWCAPDNCLAPHGLRRGEMPAYELPRGPRPVGAASISRSV